MNNTKKKYLYYYKVGENEVISHAKFWKRFWARFIDFVIAGLVGKLILTIYATTATPSNAFDVPFNEYVLRYYDGIMITGWMCSILGYLIFFWVIPLLNKKYPGQTLGKKMLSIAPMYTQNVEKIYLNHFKREVWISGFYMLMYLFILSIGTDPFYMWIKYWNWVEVNSPHTTQPNSVWEFIIYSWSNVEVMKDMTAQIWQQSLGFISVFLQYLQFFIILTILFFIAFNSKKQGFHDMIAKTIVVDLHSQRSEKEYLTTLNTLIQIPIEEPEGPPIVLKK